MNKILFRADANNQIGLGHMIRCLALAERLKNQFECVIAMLRPANNIAEYVNAHNIPLLSLDNEDDIYNEKIKYDIIVLDGYHFLPSMQKKLKNNGKKLVCIDDLVDKHYYADVVINHANSLNKTQFSVESYTKLYLGEKFTILRAAFYKQKECKKEQRSVFICFGGADVNGFASFFVSICDKVSQINSIHVVFSLDDVAAKISVRSSKLKIHKNLDAHEMANLMSRCELCIGPASNIALEALASNCKLITGLTADNQKNIYMGIKSAKGVYPVGIFQKKSSKFYEEIIDSALNKVVDSRKKYEICGDSLINVFLSLVND